MAWWREAVVYEVYPRSFADGDRDGVGDLRGLRARLPYLQWLGVDALWLSPIYPSPMADFGYDVSDYCDVDPVFGDLGEFDALLADAHARGLRVLLDWIPNHTSSRHPWFEDARSSRDSLKRDWYVWRDGRDGGPPNNWRAAFGGPAWTFDAATRQWYLHLFLPEQPDLNWSNPEARAAMHGTLRFWLDRGVDGFRADVIHLIGKNPALEDQPDELAGVDRVGIHDDPSTHALLREIRAVLDEYPGERMMVGEVNLRETLRVTKYYGEGDELHLAFNFLSLEAGFDAAAWRALVKEVGETLTPDAWPTWVLSNHDEPRHRTRFGGDEGRARCAAVLLLTLRGTPFLYQGEELGLEDADVPPERRVDPGGRDGCRAPIPWERRAPHGWGAEPWLPFAAGASERSVEAQQHDAESMLSLYRRLLALRRSSAALRSGALELVPADQPDVLCFDRTQDGSRVRVIVNFGDEPAPVGDAGRWRPLLATAADADPVPPRSAVVLHVQTY